jgi:hypothetical protein
MEDGRWKMEDGRWKMEDGKNPNAKHQAPEKLQASNLQFCGGAGFLTTRIDWGIGGVCHGVVWRA